MPKTCRPAAAATATKEQIRVRRATKPCVPAALHYSSQPFPTGVAFGGNVNRALRSLRLDLAQQTGEIYAYIIDTVDCVQNAFDHGGTGPNFQGGTITLCTCKHRLRTGRTAGAWVGTWIAGFTGRYKVGDDPRNYLVYLMRVADAAASHLDLWKTLPAKTRRAKDASVHPFGDLYRPAAIEGDPYDPRSYEPPVIGHSHGADNYWYKDIDYQGFSGRRPPLLVGDPHRSYVWNAPIIALSLPQLPRQSEKFELRELLRRLT